MKKYISEIRWKNHISILVFEGFISIDKKKPPLKMNNKKLRLVINFDNNTFIINGLWKNNNFYSLKDDKVIENVTHWGKLPKIKQYPIK